MFVRACLAFSFLKYEKNIAEDGKIRTFMSGIYPST